MSGRDRRRTSKWDLREDSLTSPENIRDRRVNLPEPESWDGEGAYGTRMSPGLNNWRKRSHGYSPRSKRDRSLKSRSQSQSRSRSRSRSPVHGFRQEGGTNERNRSRSGLASRLCKDFLDGRCRRGSSCRFAHDGNQNHDENLEAGQGKGGVSRYSATHERKFSTSNSRSNELCINFQKGKCQRGASCWFVHQGAADGFGKLNGEGENDRRNRDVPLDQSGDRDSSRSGDTPCKFFAAGNCRNGKYCRFSHSRSFGNLDRKSRLEPENNSSESLKFEEAGSWSVKVSADATKYDDSNRRKVAPDMRHSDWRVDDGSKYSSDRENRTWSDLETSHKPVDNSLVQLLESEKSGARFPLAEPRAAENWLDDTDMLPEWNFDVDSANQVVKDELGGNTFGSLAVTTKGNSLLVHDNPQHLMEKMHPSTLEKPLKENENLVLQLNRNLEENNACELLQSIEKTGTQKAVVLHGNTDFPANFMQGQSTDIQNNQVALPSIKPVKQNQVTLPTDPRAMRSLPVSLDKNLFQEGTLAASGVPSMSQLHPEVPPNTNVVTNEQLSQLTNLSASLAQILEAGKQFPQIYAALNPVQDAPPVAAPLGAVDQIGHHSVIPTQTQKPYDPILDSIQPTKMNNGDQQSGFYLSAIAQKDSAEGKTLIPAPPQSHSLQPNITEPPNEDHLPTKVEPGESHEVKNLDEKMGDIDKDEEDKKSPKENEHLENLVSTSKVDEHKKSKEGKAVRAFKFALVEFVKDLLKPSWKDGLIGKEDYKTIVKKVVDKVTGSMQEGNIPQSQEKIDHYLCASKPKLSKLVQGYVDKFKKAK